VEKRSSIIYGPAARRLSGLIAVNQDLAEWSQKKLRVPAEKIWYIPNFAASVEAHGSPPDLPGQEGMRIVCVANMRPQKDHFTLLRALGIVARRMPGVHLLLLGSSTQLNYEQQVRQEVDRLGLAGNVSFLGQRSDVPAILRAVDVGVLSSASEGLPLALLEYGVAGLATVASRVGQCPDVLDEGRAGILVPAGAPETLADAILSFLESRRLRNDLGGRLQQRVKERYSQGSVVEQICRVYDVILERVRDQLQFDQKMTWGRRPYGT